MKTLQSAGYTLRGRELTGPNQMCFQTPRRTESLVYWLFALVELVSSVQLITQALLSWRVRRRGAKQLHQMHPPLPHAEWPSVDVLLCHYTEPVR